MAHHRRQQRLLDAGERACLAHELRRDSPRALHPPRRSRARPALIAWGAFYFERTERSRWEIVDDEQLPGRAGRRTCIGATAEPFGHATVQVLTTDGKVAAEASTDERAWVWVQGLEPETDYRYRIEVDGEEWPPGSCGTGFLVSVAAMTSPLPGGATTCGPVPGPTPITPRRRSARGHGRLRSRDAGRRGVQPPPAAHRRRAGTARC